MKGNIQSKVQNLKLKDLTHSIQYGYTTSSTDKESNTYKFLRITDIQDRRVDWDTVPFAEGLNDEKVANKFLIKDGDIVFARTGATTGKSFLINGCNTPTVFASYLIRVRPDESIINSKYLYLFFQSPGYWAQVEKNKRGAAQAGINASVLGQLDIPVVSMKQQLKIVELLEKMQGLIDKRKSQILSLSSLERSIFLDMFGDPVENPKNWELKKLGDIGSWQSGGTPSRGKSEYFKGEIPWLSSGELNQIYTYSSNEHISEEAINETSAKLIPIGSLLLGMYDTAGLKSTINKVECSCNQAIAFSKLDNKVASTEYIYLVIQLIRDFLKKQQRGVRQKNFNLTMIKNINVICPPLNLQEEFKELFLKIEKQKEVLEKSLKHLENSFRSLIQQAFIGDLFND